MDIAALDNLIALLLPRHAVVTLQVDHTFRLPPAPVEHESHEEHREHLDHEAPRTASLIVASAPATINAWLLALPRGAESRDLADTVTVTVAMPQHAPLPWPFQAPRVLPPPPAIAPRRRGRRPRGR